jgi:aerobic-type carbon monoxide dehydrogenase small subunit (CoxS/CutS family)
MLYTLRVNGASRGVDVSPGTSLLAALRDALDLTGSHYGCGQGVCGACYVLLDGKATPSCITAIEAVGDRAIVTIEGIARGDELHPVQRAFIDEDAMQCGYCTSGMIVSAVALLERTPKPSRDEVISTLEPHLCRCGVYPRAVRAIERARSR